MNCTDVLHIIGDIASIITVIGGGYGLCKWIKSRKAEIVVTKLSHSDRDLYNLRLYNNGPASAYNIKITSSSGVETGAIIVELPPYKEGQLGFAYQMPVSSLTIKITWRDGLGYHKKKVRIY